MLIVSCFITTWSLGEGPNTFCKWNRGS